MSSKLSIKSQALVTLMVMALAGCGPADMEIGREKDQMNNSSPSAQAGSVAQAMGFPLPPSAIVELADYQRGLDDNARLILVLPVGEWARLKAARPFNAIPEQAYSRANLFHLGEDEGRWRPSTDQTLVAAQAPLKNGRALNVGVSRINADLVRVYLFWFQT